MRLPRIDQKAETMTLTTPVTSFAGQPDPTAHKIRRNVLDLAALPRFPLATLPTPLQRARRLEHALGDRSPRIYLKRDDLTGLAFGGNKARKLEYLVADGLANGASCLVTEGAAQSNHARTTAAAANLAGLHAHLILDARNGATIAGNLLLDHLLGADVEIVETADEPAGAMARATDDLRARGESPYLIPTGGSVPLGAVGYVAAVAEIQSQLLSLEEAPQRLYHATGSLGTQAGLVIGARALAAPFAIHGVAVSHGVEAMIATGVALANATARLLGVAATFVEDDLRINGDFVGERYGVPTPEGVAAIQLLARTESVFLDPVYSSKAMAALIADIRLGAIDPGTSVLFLHSGGGPSLFAHGDRLLR